MFGLSVPVLARIIEAGEPALYKTPDARSIQSKLIGFERIAWGLLKLTGSVRGLRIWLNAPNPELDKDLPIDYIKEKHVEDVAAMVEDAFVRTSWLMHPAAVLQAIITKLPLVPYKQACYRIVDFATLTGFDPMMPLYTLGPGVNGQRYTAKGGPTSLYVAEDPVTAQPNIIESIVLSSLPIRHIISSPIPPYS